MKTLWVDCDDTLITWLDEHDQPLDGQNPYGGGSQRWKVNQSVKAAVERWHAENPHPNRVVIWSGGGAAYAERWRDIVFPTGLYFHASKDTRLPDAGDITVDDADLKTRADLLTPQEFVTFMEACGKATAVKWSEG